MTTIPILVILSVILAFIAYGSYASVRWQREHRGESLAEEKAHFVGHFFYYNPDDGRIFVPKRSGGGYTVNFANPFSILAGVLVTAGLLALILTGAG